MAIPLGAIGSPTSGYLKVSAFIYSHGSRQPSGGHPSVRTGENSAQHL